MTTSIVNIVTQMVSEVYIGLEPMLLPFDLNLYFSYPFDFLLTLKTAF